jgi:hypothetical protein
MPYRAADRERLTVAGSAFVDERVGQAGLSRRLRPVLTTTYVRSTLVDARDGCRVTIDRQVTATNPAGITVELEGHCIVETKSRQVATVADHWLWRHGHRPLAMSKFCVGMAALDPNLPANQWNRVLRRYYGWMPARTPDTPPSSPGTMVLPAARCRSSVAPVWPRVEQAVGAGGYVPA